MFEAQKAGMFEAHKDTKAFSAVDVQTAKVLLSEEFKGFAAAPAANVIRHCLPLLKNALCKLRISRLLYGPKIMDSAAVRAHRRTCCRLWT